MHGYFCWTLSFSLDGLFTLKHVTIKKQSVHEKYLFARKRIHNSASSREWKRGGPKHCVILLFMSGFLLLFSRERKSERVALINAFTRSQFSGERALRRPQQPPRQAAFAWKSFLIPKINTRLTNWNTEAELCCFTFTRSACKQR